MKPVAVRLKRTNSHSYSLMRNPSISFYCKHAANPLSAGVQACERRFRRIDVGRKWEAHLSWLVQDLSATDASTT